jgi:hypothetical protein
VGNKQYGIEFQMDGSVQESETDTNIVNTEYGFTDRIEAGVDFDMSVDADPRALLNTKYVFAKRVDERQAMAIGTCSVANNFKSNPYIVGMNDFGFARLHAGVMRIDGKNRWFAGTDRAINDRLTFMADYTYGDENFSSAGFNYQYSDAFGMLAGAQFPNEGGDTLFTLHLVFTGK